MVLAPFCPLRRLRRHLSQRERLFVIPIIKQIGRESKFSAEISAYNSPLRTTEKYRMDFFVIFMSPPLRQILDRIHRSTVFPDFKMQMGAGCDTGIAGFGNSLTDVYIISFFNQNFTQMGIQGAVNIAV